MVLGPQPSTRETNLEVRSARHSIVVAFRVQHIVGNVHPPTQWQSEQAFCDALLDLAENLRHLGTQGSTVTMMGGYNSERPRAMTQQASSWARGYAPEDSSSASSIAAFVQEWKLSVPECSEGQPSCLSCRTRDVDLDLILCSARVVHEGCFENPRNQ